MRFPGQTLETVLREPFSQLWTEDNAFDRARTQQGDIVRALEGRRTLRFELDGRGYYLKAQSGISWSRIVEDWLHLRQPVLGAGNEWRAIEACHRIGVPTMRAVAFGERGKSWAHRESFLVTEAIEPAIDLDAYTRDWATCPPEPKLKHALIRTLGELAGKFHHGGMNHRDFYLCHFLLHTDPPPQPDALQLSLIDLHRAQIRKTTPVRWRNKDLAALHFSTLKIGLTTRDRLRFLRAYFRQPLRRILNEEGGTLRHLEREAERLAQRFERKFANRPALER